MQESWGTDSFFFLPLPFAFHENWLTRNRKVTETERKERERDRERERERKDEWKKKREE